MTKPTSQPDRHSGRTYEVRLQGHLDPRWAARLDVPTLTHECDGTTTLGGVTDDQAALHGLLQRVRDLGLAIISVIPVDPANPTRLPTDT